MKKRVLSLLLAGVMVLGMLTGCGKKEATAPEAAANSENVEVAEVEKEVVELRLIQFGTMSERMEDFFTNEFHDKVLEDLKIDLTVEFMPFGSQNDIQVMLSGGESFAFMNIPTSFTSFQENGLIASIDPEKIAEVAPNYIAARDGRGFDCVKTNGEYWALPLGSKVMASDGTNISIRNDILKEVGTSYDQIKSFEDLMDAYAKVHEKYPDMWIAPSANSTAAMYAEQVFDEGHYAALNSGSWVGVDWFTKEPFAVYESEAFEKICKLNEQFFKLGYSSKDYLTDSSFPLAQWNAGNSLTYPGYAEKAVNHDLAGVEGSDQRLLKYNDLPTFRGKDYDWGVSFAKGEEKNLERWYEFFDWIYANEDNYNFAIYGVEGEDWDYGEYDVVKPKTTDFMLSYWSYGSLYYDTHADKDPEDLKEYLALEEDAVGSPALGFAFDKTAVDVELAAVNTIIAEKVKPLYMGFGDYDSQWPAVYEELKAAGYEKCVDEYINQFNAWKAAQ